MFFKVAEVDVSMVTLGLPDMCTSLTSCAVRCLMFPGSCLSFKYNIVTSQCVLGSWIVPSKGSSSCQSNEGLFTTGAFCNTSLNYIIETNGTVSACIWISPTTYDYNTSIKFCQVRSHRQLWIGLDDLEKEKVFKWIEDGTVLDLNSTFKKQIFHPNEPDDYDNDEDCVEYSLDFASLNDMDCKNKNYCICERSTREPAF
ncbi:CD209 antigen protein 2 [Biomphalaria glabrata]|nr:CD209 antigen protein 2 [Biomphalaria glabrata]